MKQPRRSAFVKSLILGGLLAAAVLPADAGSEPYWYERYQRSVEWIDEGNFEGAATELDHLVAAKPEPRIGVRVPGWQFVDYLPYLQRARIDLARGDLDAAAVNLDRSESYGASTSRSDFAAEFGRLRRQLDQRQRERIEPVAD